MKRYSFGHPVTDIEWTHIIDRTVGILLCSETDEDIARYSVLNGSDQLFATKYKLYLPSEEEFLAEIEEQKDLYYLQQNADTKADC